MKQGAVSRLRYLRNGDSSWRSAQLVSVTLVVSLFLAGVPTAKGFTPAPPTPASTVRSAEAIGLVRLDSVEEVARSDGAVCGYVYAASFVESVRGPATPMRFFSSYRAPKGEEVLDFLVIVSSVPANLEDTIREAPFSEDVLENLRCRLQDHEAPGLAFPYAVVPRLHSGMVRTDSNLLSMPGFADLPVLEDVEGWGPVVGWELVRKRIESMLGGVDEE